jgi:hypothetical protein
MVIICNYHDLNLIFSFNHSDLLSWLQNLEFDWLPGLLEVIDPYLTSTMDDVNNFIAHLKNDCVCFGLDGSVKVLEVLDPQPESQGINICDIGLFS